MKIALTIMIYTACFFAAAKSGRISKNRPMLGTLLVVAICAAWTAFFYFFIYKKP